MGRPRTPEEREAARLGVLALADAHPEWATDAILRVYRATVGSVGTEEALQWLRNSDGPWAQAAWGRLRKGAVNGGKAAKNRPLPPERKALKASFVGFANAHADLSINEVREAYAAEHGTHLTQSTALGWLHANGGAWHRASQKRRVNARTQGGSTRLGCGGNDGLDKEAFIAFANANPLWGLDYLLNEWRRAGGKLGKVVARRWLNETNGEWMRSVLKRTNRSMRGDAVVVPPPIPPTCRDESGPALPFSPPHGPPARKERPAIDPSDLAAVCRQYVAEWRKIRGRMAPLTLADYQAANAAMRARAELTTRAGREYQRRKTVSA